MAMRRKEKIREIKRQLETKRIDCLQEEDAVRLAELREETRQLDIFIQQALDREDERENAEQMLRKSNA